MNHIFAVSGTEVLKTVLKILTIYYLVMEWNMCFSDHFCGFNMQERFEILWEGVEAAKNHHKGEYPISFNKAY